MLTFSGRNEFAVSGQGTEKRGSVFRLIVPSAKFGGFGGCPRADIPAREIHLPRDV